MCGIILVRRAKGMAQKLVRKRYNKQAHRGTDGFGYIAVDKGFVKGIVRAQTENEIMAKLKAETASEILFHHRKPTSTPNYIGATHPIAVKNKMLDHDYYVVHNGMVHNSFSLKDDHTKLGFEYTTEYSKVEKSSEVITFNTGETFVEKEESVRTTKFNDSEALAIDIALYIEGKNDKITSTGTISFIIYQTDKKGKILATFYGHNSGNPLICEFVDPKSKKGKHNNKEGAHFILKSVGNGRTVKEDVMYRIDGETGVITDVKVDIGTHFSRNYPAKNRSSQVQGAKRTKDRDETQWGFGERQQQLLPANVYRQSRASSRDQTDLDEWLDLHSPDSEAYALEAKLEEGFEEYTLEALNHAEEKIVGKIEEKKEEIEEWKGQADDEGNGQDHRDECKSIIVELQKELGQLMIDFKEVIEEIATLSGFEPSYSVEEIMNWKN